MVGREKGEGDCNKGVLDFMEHDKAGYSPPVLKSLPAKRLVHTRDTRITAPVRIYKACCFILGTLQGIHVVLITLMRVPCTRAIF